ncbi:MULTISPECIES: acyltransferase [unclassified Pseudomonas]|uniref:acyltransferase family protein n=1 Tax=unclassified Pseudomonas TaxID=196821 RepID=UPI00111C1701|nr:MULTISPECIES: acyltransferase [unclassified Pseudomonas]MBX8471512.1 acyltransferase [Pseudomonas sp. RIT778]UVM24888.1 acyltransferase [Pseudomonas sp. B21-021]
MNSSTIERKRWTSVQIMRGLAALLVAAYHFEDQLLAVLGIAAPGPLSWFGFFGVDLFFVTSGFVLWPMIAKEKLTSTDRVGFLLGRTARIYIPYLAVVFVILFFGLGSGNADVAKSIMLYPQRISTQLLPVAWTLVYEVLFYWLAFALMFIYSSRKRYCALSIVVGLFVLKAVVVISSGAATFYDYNAFMADVSWNRWVDGLLPGYLTSLWFVEFFCGVTLAYLLSLGWESRLAKMSIVLWMAAALVLSLAIYLSINVYGVSMTRGDMFLPRIILFGGAAVLIFAAAIGTEIKDVDLGISEKITRVFVWLGDGSYSIYLIHTVAFGIAYGNGLRTWCSSNGFSGSIVFVGYFFLVIIVSGAIGNYVELPVHRKIMLAIRRKSFFRVATY